MTEKLDERLLEYQRTGDPQIRQELVIGYSGLVRKLALRLYASFDRLSDVEDVVPEGLLVLMRAMDTFDPTRGITFESYAVLRVRGGMMDYLRTQYWCPRSVYQKARALTRTQQVLATRLGDEPYTPEMCKEPR